MKKHLFGDNIEPACQYCEKGRITKDGGRVVCDKNGIVPLYHSCRKFVYAPLKRIPKSTPLLPSYDEFDFTLE